MKRKLVIMMTFISIMISSAFCGIDYKRYNDCVFDKIDYKSNIENVDVEQVIKDYVPLDCRNAFLHYTECQGKFDTINLRIQLLAIGQWESGWKVTVSNKNKNGTVDLGYLALNSANAKSNWFMSRFGPNEDDGFDYDDDNLNERYLIACIKFYKALYSAYGEDAAYCYNAGESRYVNKRIPSSTYTYKKRVSEYVEKFVQESEYKSRLRHEFEAKIQRCIHGGSIEYDVSQIVKNNINRINVNNIAIVKIHAINARYILTDKNKRMIDAALNTAWIPNTEFVCIGYIRKYGNHLAPVFKSKYTGEKIIC